MSTPFTTSNLIITTKTLRSTATQFLEKKWHIATKTYPHISWFGEEGETLKIATVRSMQERLSFGHTANQPHYCVVLGIDSASTPAQNALLKIVEEPPPNTQILLVGTQLNKILPTIRSRCLVTIQSEAVDTAPAEKIYQQLKESDIPTALTLAETYKDRQEALELTAGLIALLHALLEKKPTAPTKNHLKSMLTLKKQLEANCNVQLVVEEAFLQCRNK